MVLAPNERIRLWREFRGLSQTDLANRAGMDKTKLCRLESGDLVVRAVDLETIARALGVTMPKFYGRIPKPAKAA